jgi:hypothetical protein
MQMRLGVNPWIACAIGVLLSAQPRVWQNLLYPEVYAPSLAFLAGSAYLLLKYVRLGRRRDLLIAALLFGIAAANRPPTVLALPFFVVAWWQGARSAKAPWRSRPASVAAAAACAVLPAVYSIAFLWVRDTPATACNYIEQYNAEAHELPDANAGPSARLRRITWHAGGEQFRELMGNDWASVWNKLRWLRGEFAPGQELPSPLALVVSLIGSVLTFIVAAAVVVIGLVVTARRCGAAGWLLAGMIVQSVIFVCAYRVYDQAADVLPLIWASAVALGVSLSALFPRGLSQGRRAVAIGLMVLACVWTVADAPDRPDWARDQDATPFVAAVDMASFPDGAVVCSSWGTSPPLWYAQHVLTDRDDVKIINAGSVHWLEMIEQYPGRPVFFTDSRVRVPDGWELTPYRKLWRLEGSEKWEVRMPPGLVGIRPHESRDGDPENERARWESRPSEYGQARNAVAT